VEVGLLWPPETFLRRKLEGLAAAGMAVTVVSRGGPRRGRDHLPGVRLVRLPGRGDNRLITLAGLLWASLRLLVSRPSQLLAAWRTLRRGEERLPSRRAFAVAADVMAVLATRPDVLHFEWESAAVRSLPLLEACMCPVVLSTRGSGVNVHPHTGQGHLAARYPEIFARAAAVHCVSEAVREEAARYGLEHAKARVIHPAVNTDYFRPPPVAESAPEVLRVVGVGRLGWVKGYGYAIEAVASLARAGVPVTYEIIGGEPEPDTGEASDRSRLLYLIHELGLHDRVTLLGAVPPGAVRERLWASDVLLQASLSEGLPNTVLEAMACGLPVVVTDCGGLREAVDHGIEGLVCPRRSPQALADALGSLRDRALARRMGEAGRKRVCAEFTLERQIDSFRRLYDEVVEVSRAP
jgi:colanic acid/amylovoran biosynthesis glycosyltransferase